MKRYFKHKIENLLNISRIITVRYFKFEKNFKAFGEAHDFWEIIYADKNDITVALENERLVLKEGEIYFHKPNEFHTHIPDGKSAPEIFVASFVSKSEAMRFFENRKIKLKDEFKPYIKQIVNESENTFVIPKANPFTKKLELASSPTLGGQQIIKNTLELLLIKIMRDTTETADGNVVFLKKNQLDNKLVNDIIKILEGKVYSRITIDEITSSTYYGRAYVFREFKRVTGKTIMDYYNGLKIDKAKAMLEGGEKSVREIAEALCYDTPNYFSKSFKTRVGKTPTEYRKSVSI